jgi:hypothetical protein
MDDGPWQMVVLIAASPGSPLTELVLPVPALPGTPNARTHHDLHLTLFSSNEQHDRWHGGTSSSSYLSVAGAVLAAGATTVAPVLLPRRALIYGDSITEGVNSQLFDWSTGTCSRTGLHAEGAFKSWCFGFGEAISAEVSNAAFAAQGYSTYNSLGYGGVPPLLTPGNDAMTAWDKLDASNSRLPLLRCNTAINLHPPLLPLFPPLKPLPWSDQHHYHSYHYHHRRRRHQHQPKPSTSQLIRTTFELRTL